MGTYGDPLQFISRVRLAPLSESSQLGRICMMDVERSVSGAPTAEGTIITASQIGAAFRSTPPAALKNTFEAIVGAEAIVRELDDLLTKAVGTSNSVTFDPLAKCLKDLQKALAPYAVQGKTENVEASPDVSASDSDTSSDTSAGAAITGSVRSRQDVIRVLEQICDFYRRTEPSSPVPLLLQRARRLVDMDFVQLLTELTPESLNQIKLIAGIRADSTEGESEG